MHRYLLTISYVGTEYAGWQIQNNAKTVQSEVNAALQKIVGELPSNTVGCSRTDSKVHANNFCLHFDTLSDVPPKNILRGLNSYLPIDIAAKDILEVDNDFHARFDCRGKEYIYKIYTLDTKDPFKENRFLHYPYKLDVSLLNKTAKNFVGTHDFKAFCASGSSVTSTVRTVFDCSVEKVGEDVILKISGDGFLYNMVRIIVGTLLEVNEGKISPDKISEIMSSKDRNLAGRTAKPQGLYLNKVFYKFTNNKEG